VQALPPDLGWGGRHTEDITGATEVKTFGRGHNYPLTNSEYSLMPSTVLELYIYINFRITEDEIRHK
jgi:hypothetical protein